MERVKITPKELYFIPCGTYGQQWFKPLRTNSDDALINRLYHDTKGGTDLSIQAVSKTASSIIAPSNTTAGKADIINGWDQKRYRFILVIEVAVNEATYVQIATGYTDNDCISGNNIDPDLRLYFNSIQSFTRSFQPSPTGLKTVLIPFDDTMLIKPSSVANDPMSMMMRANTPLAHMRLNNDNQLLRPQDVFNRFTFKMVTSGYSYPNNAVPNAASIMTNPTINHSVSEEDARSINGNSVKPSNRRNGNSSNYVSTLLNSYKGAKSSTKDGDMYTIANMVVNDDSLLDKHIYENKALYEFSKVFRDYPRRGYISFKHLSILMPGLSFVTKVFNLTNIKKLRPLADHTTVESIASKTQEAYAATVMFNALPNLMGDSWLSQVSFFASNNYQNGKIKITWATNDAAKSLIQGITPYIDKFLYRLTNEVLVGLCHCGALRFDMTVFADIYGDMTINVGFNNNPPEPYCLPFHCDSLFSSIIGRSTNDLEKLSTDMLKLSTNICQ